MRVGIVILPDDRWWAAEPKWRAAEEYGFDHAWTYDHLGWRSLVDGPWFNAVPTLSAAAMVTSSIRLGTFVASPNFRHPIPFNRELLTLDDLSDGRLLIGLGAGGSGYDVEVFGQPELSGRQRVERYAEFAEALDGSLRVDGFDYSGAYYTVRGSRNLPGPVQRLRPPMLLAANGAESMRVVARLADGWITTGPAAESQQEWWRGVRELSERFDETIAQTDRDASALHRYLSLDAAPVFSLSSMDAFADAAGRAAELGFTDIVVHWPRSGAPYQGRESVLEQVAHDLLPQVHGW